MTPTLLGASVVASFLGGMLALLAPCCVTFVFPAYFASAFKAKTRILLMTFIFFLGMAIVLVPVGLGVVALTRTIARFHYEVFLLGGFFLIILSILSLMGKTLHIPFSRNPDFKKSDPSSIFLLGVFSGAASSCCTPVLIGVLTITALSGTFLYALILSLTYVLGMVFPLLIFSYFWDKYDFSKAKILKGKVLRWSLFGRKFYIHSAQLVASIIFGIMGLLIIILTLTGKTSVAPEYQAKMSAYFVSLSSKVTKSTQVIPEYIWAISILIVLILLIKKVFKSKNKE